MNRKQLNVAEIAFLFSGCFLGAGFVSGQELWQFFGCFGRVGFWGLLLSAVLFALCGILLIRLAQSSGVKELDETVIRWNIPWLRHLVAFLQCLFLFGIVAIMIAGGGALAHQLYGGVPTWCASLVMSGLVMLLALRGLKGVATAFAVCVPVMSLATVGLCIAALGTFGPEQLTAAVPACRNPILPAWPVAAVTYVAYNTFGSIGILTPFGDLIEGKKKVYQGILLGTGLLMLIAVSVLVSLFLCPSSTQAEMPMLELACRINRNLGYAYGVLLLAGIYGTALSSTVAICTYLQLRYPAVQRKGRGKPCLLVMIGAAFFASLGGFGDLISTVYPVFGYLGALSLGFVFGNYLHYRRRGKVTEGAEKKLDPFGEA